MFSSSKKPILAASTDKVWKTKLARHRGIATEALRALTQARTPVVFFFFEDDQRQFVEFLDSNKAPYFTVTHGNRLEALEQKGTIFVMDAFTTASPEAISFLTKFSLTAALTILFLGHYPLVTPEVKLLENLDERFGPLPRVFCLSLEDALLQTFGTDRIRPLLQSLGVGDEECIEHAMVSKAILRAREKLETHVEHETKTKSEADWFAKNVKPT